MSAIFQKYNYIIIIFEWFSPPQTHVLMLVVTRPVRLLMVRLSASVQITWYLDLTKNHVPVGFL